MTIKQRFRVIILAAALSALAVGSVMYLSSQHMDTAIAKARFATELVRGLTGLHLTTFDYVLYSEEQAKEQWLSKFSALQKTLSNKTIAWSSDEGMVIKGILDDSAGIKSLFEILISQREGPAGSGTLSSEEFNKRLMVQILMRSQKMISNAYRLNTLTQLRIESVKRKENSLVVVSLVLLTLVLSILVYYVRNKIVLSIGRLLEGTRTIAEGNFSHRIAVKSNDEIGELNRAFNSMAGRLEDSYTDLTRELTLRTANEQRILHLNRLYSVLSEINQTFIRVRDSGALLREICRIIVEKGHFKMAWVGFADYTHKVIHPVATYGSEGYVESIQVSIEDNPEGRGPVGAAVRTRSTVVCNDILEDPRMQPWHSKAKEYCYNSVGAFPLEMRGEVVGTLNVYSSEVYFFSSDEVSLLEKVAADTSFALDVIETERKFLESEQRFRTAFEGAAIGMALTSIDGHFIAVNRALSGMLGYSEEELTSLSFMDITFSDDLHVSNDMLTKMLSGEVEASHIEKRYRGKQGKLIWVHLSTCLLRDNSGKPLYFISQMQDITERKRIEEELRSTNTAIRASEHKYRMLFMSNPHPMWVYDIETFEILDVNDAAIDHYGYSREEFLSMTIKDIRPPEDVSALLKKVSQRAEGIDHAGIWRHKKKDGSIISVEITSHIIDYAGRSAEIVLVNDVTERQKIEEELRKLSSAVEQSPVSILILNRDGTIEYVNPRVTSLTGYGLEEVRGTLPSFLEPGKHQRVDHKLVWEALRSGQEWRGEVQEKKKSGESFWELVTISPVMERSGEIAHYLAVKEDITERIKLEQQLRYAQKMEAVGQLAGGIAHDFNNILSAIIGYSSVISMKLDKESPLRTYIDKILSSSERAVQLTQNLLAFSRRQILSPKPVMVNEMVKGIERLLSRIIGEDTEIRTILSDKELILMAESSQIEQVLINLCTNARDAMPEGGSITIKVEPFAMDEGFKKKYSYGKPGLYAHISVADTGTGMADTVKGRIFEPFFTTKEVGKGTGLGLSIAYGIVKQHGGYINYESIAGSGTIFHLYLPLMRKGVEAKEGTPAAMIPSYGTETILLAEDDQDLRKLTKGILEEFGYTIIEAADGEEALEKFKKYKNMINLLILDVIMPKLTGKRVYDEVRIMQPHIKAIFISGYTEDIIKEKEMITAGLSFVSKPVSPTELLRKIREVLNV